MGSFPLPQKNISGKILPPTTIFRLIPKQFSEDRTQKGRCRGASYLTTLLHRARYKTHRLDFGGSESIREIPRGGSRSGQRNSDHCCRRRQGGYRETDEGIRTGRHGDCPPLPDRRLSRGLRYRDCRGIMVVHAFQKKSRTGISTPKAEIDLIRVRLSRLRRELLQ